jgi:hypothetical protein
MNGSQKSVSHQDGAGRLERLIAWQEGEQELIARFARDFYWRAASSASRSGALGG